MWALDIFQVEIDLEHTNVHHELVVRQSTVDQISPIPLFALLHRPVFDRMVDWLAVTLDRRISAFETVGVTVGHRSC